MAHQSPGGGFGNAHPVSFDTAPRTVEVLDTNPSDYQPPGVDEKEEEEWEPQSLEEALLGE